MNKTVMVRIAVAVDPKGAWNCCGGHGMPDDDAMNFAVDPLESGEARYWIETELALPTVPTVGATVTPVAEGR